MQPLISPLYIEQSRDGADEVSESKLSGSTKMSAVYTVLNTSELLESILVYSSTHDVLFHQRVSMQWRDVITGSLKLQQKLFLKPNTDIRCSAIEGNHLSPRISWSALHVADHARSIRALTRRMGDERH